MSQARPSFVHGNLRLARLRFFLARMCPLKVKILFVISLAKLFYQALAITQFF